MGCGASKDLEPVHEQPEPVSLTEEQRATQNQRHMATHHAHTGSTHANVPDPTPPQVYDTVNTGTAAGGTANVQKAQTGPGEGAAPAVNTPAKSGEHRPTPEPISVPESPDVPSRPGRGASDPTSPTPEAVMASQEKRRRKKNKAANSGGLVGGLKKGFGKATAAIATAKKKVTDALTGDDSGDEYYSSDDNTPVPKPASSNKKPAERSSSGGNGNAIAAAAVVGGGAAAAAVAVSASSTKNGSNKAAKPKPKAASGSGVTTLSALPAVDPAWRCKEHRALEHRFFLNYRVASDAALAEMTAFAIQAKDKKNTVFLDRHCLVDGEDWESGFLNGLRTSTVIVLLISEAALEGIKNAHKWGDNVLLEYECALEASENRTHLLLPVLIGKYVNVEGADLYKKFSAFGTKCYADEPHAHDRSHCESVREFMKQLFKLQGIFADPRDMKSVVDTISERADAFAKLKKKEAQDAAAADARAKREAILAERRGQRESNLASKGTSVASVDSATAAKLGKEMHELCSGGNDNLSKIEDLLKRGADPDIHEGMYYSYTPLHQAIYYGTPEMVELLLTYGADTSIKDSYNYNAMEHAKQYSKTGCLKILREFAGEAESAETLGSDIEAAARAGNASTLREAIEAARTAGCLSTAVNHVGPSWSYTGLHYACYSGYTECVRLLVDAGADLTLKEYSNQTAKELATYYNKSEIVKIIEEAE